ncbi:MAG: hypothetical protein ACXWM7_03855 [Parachlamydiaceae bacterium]
MSINNNCAKTYLFDYTGVLPAQKTNKSFQDQLSKIFDSCVKENLIADLNRIQTVSIQDKKISYSLDDGTTETIQNQSITAQFLALLGESNQLTRDIVGETILKVAEDSNLGPTLYLYSSGGGGHKSAKDARIEQHFKTLHETVKARLNPNPNKEDLQSSVNCLLQDERIKNPAKFADWCKEMDFALEVDVLQTYLGKIGIWAADQWDKAQQMGEIEKQESLASQQWLSDILFGPIIFLGTLIDLISNQPSQIVSTQAIATPSILLAIKFYNQYLKREGQKDVQLHLYMTDMPTEFAKHFFDALKRIKENEGKEFFTLHAPKPKNEIDWPALCGIPKEQVHELEIDKLPIRQDFLNAISSYSASNQVSVEIKISDQAELTLLNRLLTLQNRETFTEVEYAGPQLVSYSMAKEDRGFFVMLGSQPTESAIQAYVDQFVEMAKRNPTTHHHLFSFTGRFCIEEDCFYKRLSTYLTTKYLSKQNKDNWPTNLTVIPLSFQSAQQLVGLEMACDTITRSGGATIMELLALNEIHIEEMPRKRLIHAQRSGERSLEESIPLWERGNFYFLQEALNTEKQVSVAAVDPTFLIETLEGLTNAN